MTEVIKRVPCKLWAVACLSLVAGVTLSWGQQAPQTRGEASVPQTPSAEKLYLQLRSVGLDKSRLYRVREASLDRGAVHISLDDGTIAFTEDVAGRITGAFFEGEGEILLIPPDRVERASMALFTEAAILEERFATAYFRFNDDTYAELQPALRPADNAGEFVLQWNEAARNLAQSDALRLLLTFSRWLPVQGGTSQSAADTAADPDRMLHARLQGGKLGTFDVFFDSRAAEQIWVGQLKRAGGEGFYDVWTAFSAGPEARLLPAKDKPETEIKPQEVAISHYKIKAQVKPPTTLNAEALLQLEVGQSGQRALLFELSRFLKIREVTADGSPLEFIQNQALEGTELARRGNDLLAVVFPQPLRAGQRMELRFVYGGDVLSEAGGGLLYVGARGTWYPNRGMAMSNFDLEFHYPPGWTLVATGKRMEVAPLFAAAGDGGPANAQGEQVSRWVSERPIPVAGFNLGKYERATARAGDVIVESYAAAGVERTFPQGRPELILPQRKPLQLGEPPLVIAPPPPSPARNAQLVADRSARAVEFFARRFGPYPYSDLALTQMPGELSQGWPGLIFLSSFNFLTATEKAQLRFDRVGTILSNGVIAHETAHQWWGDLIIWSSYRDQWIFEGLANYSSLMLLESQDAEQFRNVMQKYHDDLLQKNKDGIALMDAGPVTLGPRLLCSRFPNGYEAISYGRGTWLFHMLRHLLRDAERKTATRAPGTPREEDGDEPFVRALRKVRERFAGKVMTTADLLHVFEEDLPPSLWYEGRKSLDWFYQGWVNGTAIPRLELQGVKYVHKGGSTIVSGAIRQKNAPDDLVTSVPLYAVVAGKTPVLAGRVFADGIETSFHLAVPSGTRRIVLDPNQTMLVRNR